MSNQNKVKMGVDGVFTLTLSFFLIFLSLGLSLLLVVYKVYKTAVMTVEPQGSVDIVVVHGMQLDKNTVCEDYSRRLEKALYLYQKYNLTVLLLGGFVGKNTITEAEAGKDYLLKKGMNEENIFTESRSRHTLENLSEARKIIKSLDLKECGLLSNRYHLARVSALAKGLRINASLVAAEEKFILDPKSLLKVFIEAVYLHWYFTGKYWSYLTKNSKSINKIS